MDDPNAPADTSMMRIVHAALRRDLERAHLTLTSEAPPDDRQRRAIAEQLRWMMRFLEAHHRSEDAGLYPLVRERDPAAAELLDAMATDHVAVATAIAALDGAASSYAASSDAEARAAVVEAIDALCDPLLPHLRREEDEVMPVVSAAITNAEWRAIEQQHNLDGKSMGELAREGHWLIDDATPEDRALVLGLVPFVPRQLLLHGFGPAARRRSRACWRPGRRVQHQGSTSVATNADIDAVWAIVRDPTRVGEWSHECVDGVWVGGASDARPGARFRGRNKQGMWRWGRLCEVVRAEPYELVWRTVPTRLYPDSTEWALRLRREGGRTTIEQTFQVVKGSMLEPIYATVLPAHRDRTEALKHDLERIGELAQHEHAPGLSAA